MQLNQFAPGHPVIFINRSHDVLRQTEGRLRRNTREDVELIDAPIEQDLTGLSPCLPFARQFVANLVAPLCNLQQFTERSVDPVEVGPQTAFRSSRLLNASVSVVSGTLH